MPRTRPCAVLPFAVEKSPSQTTIAVPSIAAHFMRRIGGAGSGVNCREGVPSGGETTHGFGRARRLAGLRRLALRRRRPLPLQRGNARAPLGAARVAPAHGGRRRRDFLRRLRAQRGLGLGHRRLQRVERRRAPAAGDRPVGRVGGVPAGRRDAAPCTSTTSARAWPATASTRPIRSPCGTRRRRARARSSGTSSTAGATTSGRSSARAEAAIPRRRSRSTRCTSGPGAACPRRATGR